MSFFSWFRFQTPWHRNSRSRTTRVKRTPLFLEQLEDRTVTSAVTVLGSHLHTAGGQPEQYRVVETGVVARGDDLTFDASPGVYHLAVADGAGTYGSFTVASDGTISSTTGAATASGTTIDFDLAKLAAVTVVGTDLKTAAGLQEYVNVD